MGYVGYKPASVPLTSADITDGIIVNADISSTAGITLNKLSGNPNFRNIVINGDMQIAQRNTSVASISVGSTYNTVDRMMMQISSLGTWTQSQDTDVPTGYGFRKSLKLACTTADASPSASDYLVITQRFEGQNLQYLKKGTANAVSLTASFWVKSTKTGTFICELWDNDNSRSISKSYTISASNTWEFKTLTFAGDTTGAFDNDNATSLSIVFWLGVGSDWTSGTLATSWATTTSANRAVGQVNIADSTSNSFLITGIQLEAGTSATDFEFLPYDVSLIRCLRYYEKWTKFSTNETPICLAQTISASQAFGKIPYTVTKRTYCSTTSSSAGDFQALNPSGGAWSTATGIAIETGTTQCVRPNLTGLTGMNTGGCSEIRINGSTGYIAVDAEL